jgi:hypothetical protein
VQEEFIAPLPRDKNNKNESSLSHWDQVPTYSLHLCPLQHEIKEKPQIQYRAVRFVCNGVPNCQLRNKVALENFKDLSVDGEQAEFPKQSLRLTL